jgi:hypothetical protein
MEKIIFRGLVGSHAFGTATKTSDKDIAEIFICDRDDLLGFNYKEHDDIDKDNRRYEVGKFIKLLMNGNPNMLEILYTPKDCILIQEPEFEMIKQVGHNFITKQLFHTFVGYANTQINKAQGLNKKINWEKEKTERKDVLDFCFVYDLNNSNTKAIPVKNWLNKESYMQEMCGLVAIDHMRYCYLLYVDELQWVKEANHRYDIQTHEFKGIVQSIENSNDISLSSVPEYCIPKCILYFNKDGYSSHCKDYREYMSWLEKRNLNRFQTNQKHGQDYDSKNIMHMVRLLQVAKEIVETKQIRVRRTPEEREYLLKIKSGQEDLKQLVKWAETEKTILSNLYEKSDLESECNRNFCNELLIKIRNANI